VATEDDRFQRWQKITLEQMGYTLNLILTFAIGGLGYCFVLLKDSEFYPTPTARCTFLISMVSLSICAVAGFMSIFTRLWDFRMTTRRAHNDPLAPSLEEVRLFGKITWCLLFLQVGTFATGMLFLGITLFLTYGSKLH
jgi:ABC-type uncharacterized transport system permease subunit